MKPCSICTTIYCSYHLDPVGHVGKLKGGHVCSEGTVGGKLVTRTHKQVAGAPEHSVTSAGAPSAEVAPASTPTLGGYPAFAPPPPYAATAADVASAKVQAESGATAINDPGRWDFFLSHTQRSGHATTLAAELCASLVARGYTCWYDVKMRDKSMLAMNEGVLNSTLVIAIITGPCVNPDLPEDDPASNAYFSRELCLRELQWAREADVPIQPIIRSDDKKLISQLMEAAPSTLKHLVNIDFIDFDRSKVARFDVDVDSLVEALKKVQSAR
jgi:hypothetical protein